MNKTMTGLAGLIMAGTLWGPGNTAARAAGLLVADGGFGGQLEQIDHSVDVTLNNGVAVTHVTQVFRNLESRQVEALYTFPVPAGASVSNFSMWINGKEMVGEVVEKKRAREIYDSYKQVRRDPGLLEQKDFKTFEMRIFPIAPKADQKVMITYYQEVDTDHDRATYVYPLQTTTRGEQSRVDGKFAFNLNARSTLPITDLESPSHGDAFVIARHGESYLQASLEAADGDLSRDIVLSYGLEKAVSGLDLVTSRADKDDGFFLAQFTVGDDLAKLDTGMDYVFLLDVSGSMAEDRKLPLSLDSIAAFMQTLGADDRMEVMTFNVQPNLLFRGLRAADDAARGEAETFLKGQTAKGGTVLAPALRTAYNYATPDRPLNIVLLSDGMTEPGERAELVDLIRSRPSGVRVFCVGVGNEMNKPVMDQLTKLSGGLAAFLSPSDNLRRQAEAFRRKLTHPAVGSVRLKVDGVDVTNLEPATLPDIFHGAPLRIYGRYARGGEATVTINGTVQGRERTWTRKVVFPETDDTNPEIERMWALRRIDRLNGEGGGNAVAEIVRLGQAFSIVTEHTSFLVLENDAEYQRWKIDRTNVLRTGRDRRAQQQVREQLARIRDEGLAGLGPNPDPKAVAAPQTTRATPSATPRDVASAPRVQQPSRDWSPSFGGGGGGPVGPLFLLALAWLRRLRAGRKPTA